MPSLRLLTFDGIYDLEPGVSIDEQKPQDGIHSSWPMPVHSHWQSIDSPWNLSSILAQVRTSKESQR